MPLSLVDTFDGFICCALSLLQLLKDSFLPTSWQLPGYVALPGYPKSGTIFCCGLKPHSNCAVGQSKCINLPSSVCAVIPQRGLMVASQQPGLRDS